jgi:hypothetical protein
MSVTISIRETCTLEPDNLYQVREEVTASSEISSSIFVFRTVDQTFDHVAVPWDMENLQYENQDDAETNGAEFYRLDTVVRSFTQQSRALDFSGYTRARVNWLAGEYGSATHDFVGVRYYTYTV